MTAPDPAEQIKALVDQMAAERNAALADRDTALAQVSTLVGQIPPAPAPPEVRMLGDNFPTAVKSGAYVPSGYVGAGPRRTEYRMRDGSSTRAPEIAALKAPKTNPFNLMWMGGMDGAPVDDALAYGFSLYGPTLGHTYGGLFIGPGARAVVQGVGVYGIQGKLNGPPEETPSLSLYRQSGFLLEGVLLDGRNAAGQPIASSPLMLSSCGSGTIHGLDAEYAAYGFAAAFWRQSGQLWITDSTFANSRRNWNFEQVEDGAEINAVRPVLGATPAGWHAQISTHGPAARAKLNVFDPVNGQFVVKTYGAATPVGNGMQDSDIKAYLRGKLATSQLVKIVH